MQLTKEQYNKLPPHLQSYFTHGCSHPTVKPIKLMTYLIELGCPPNGVVLDPFCGSGTTCISAKQLGRKYIGIELDEGYCEIAEQRLTSVPTTLLSYDTSSTKEIDE